MERDIRRVLVIVNLVKDDGHAMAEAVRSYLERKGIKVVIFGFREKPSQPNIEDIDLAISLGGDGTVLFSSRILAAKRVPILAVNLGLFGFITEITMAEWEQAFEKYSAGLLGISERLMLRVEVEREGRSVAAFKGLNDAVVSSEGISKLVNLYVSLSEISVGNYRADGVIVSTPTGSTAYSAAAGGPILHPEMEAMIVNPICPFTLSNRPIVIPGSETVDVLVERRQRTNVILTVDGQNVYPLQPNDRVRFQRGKEKALLVRSDQRTFYEVLRKKLNWSGGSHA